MAVIRSVLPPVELVVCYLVGGVQYVYRAVQVWAVGCPSSIKGCVVLAICL